MRTLIVRKRSKQFIKKLQKKKDSKTHKTAEQAASRDEIVALLTQTQRRDGEPLKGVFERAAIGLTLPYAPLTGDYACYCWGPPRCITDPI